MIVSLIVAIGKNRILGKDNKMLWHLKEEFRHFKQTTMGHHLIMGRKTFESIGQALPGRITLVVSRNKAKHFKDALVCHSLEAALEKAKQSGENEAFICGGGSLYQEALSKNLVQRIYLTEVEYQGEADVYFPHLDDQWQILKVEEHPQTETNPLVWRWKLLERLS